MNLQICFMNETSSDSESAPGPDGKDYVLSSPSSLMSPSSPSSSSSTASSIATSPSKHQQLLMQNARPQVLSLPPLRLTDAAAYANEAPLDEADFFARQARLQTEARLALAQAKEMAHMQMEVERQKLKANPITEMVRASLQKVCIKYRHLLPYLQVQLCYIVRLIHIVRSSIRLTISHTINYIIYINSTFRSA